MIRAFCFDMDGTLFDTERLDGLLICRLVADQGYAITEPQWKSLIGTSWAHTYDSLRAWFPGFDLARFQRDWGNATFEDYFRTQGPPYKPGAQALLASLKADGYKLAVCSSNLPDVVRLYVSLAGWADVFDCIVTADQVAHPKPAPDIFLRAAELMGALPADCVGVEDSPSGIRAVRAAGMTSILVPDLIPYTDDLAPYVDHCLRDLTQVRAALSL